MLTVCMSCHVLHVIRWFKIVMDYQVFALQSTTCHALLPEPALASSFGAGIDSPRLGRFDLRRFHQRAESRFPSVKRVAWWEGWRVAVEHSGVARSEANFWK